MQKNNWKKCKLSNIADVRDGTHESPKEVLGRGFPLVTSRHIHNGKVDLSNTYKISETDFIDINKRSKVDQGDILISMIGTVGQLAYIAEKPLYAIKNVGLIKPFDKCISKYIFYYLISPFAQAEISTRLKGTTQQYLSLGELRNFPIYLPPIEEQKRIAGVLGAFDDKIELLQKQNTTLENMAKALFKSWFVDFDVVHAKQQGQPKAAVIQQYHLTEELYNLFPSSFEPSTLGPIPTGWQVKTLGQVSLCFDSKRVPLSNRDRASRRGVYPYFGATSVMDYINDFLFDDIYLLLGEDGSVIKNDGTPFLQYVFGKIWVNNHAHVLQGKEPITTEFLYLFLSDFQIQPYVTGAVQAKLNQKNMNSIPMVIPDKNILNYFNIYAKRLFNKIIHNHKQIQTLTEMRDALLPRLISGKIRV